MQQLLLGLAGVVLFLAGVFAVYKANGRPRFRYRQMLLPVVALVYGLVAIWRFNDVNALVQSFIASLTHFVPALSQINAGILESIMFNFLILVNFVIIKGLYKLIMAAVARVFEQGLGLLASRFYTFDEDYQFWFLRPSWYGARRLFRNLYVAGIVIAALLFLAACQWPDLPAFRNPFYPALAVLVLGETCFCLLGISKEEYLEDVTFEADGAMRVFQYAKVQEVLEHYFADRILRIGSRGAKHASAGTHADFCDGLMASDDYDMRLAGAYFKSLVQRGVLSADERQARFGALNHDMALESVRLLKGQSVVFATPFYYDCVPYVFLPLNAQLMRNKRALALYGSSASEERLLQYLEEGLEFATGVEGMWRVGSSMSLESALPNDVALLPFSALGSVKTVLDHEDFLREVGFVIVVDPSSLLATYQIGLNYLAEYLSLGEAPTYCIFDRNSDGLVDSLSHALRTNLTEVAATEYAQGSAIYMMWDADGENLQHRLMPGVAQYLGMGTELGLVALKSQVSQVSWASNTAVPLADQRWIDGQYYGDLLAFAQLPQEQLQLDRHFEWFSDLWDMRKRSNRFIVAEDEYANLYETFRQFITRGVDQVFVNVLSPDYLLRSYMVSNYHMFEADPKAVPSFVPDFSKSQRNAIFSIVMVMAQCDGLLEEEQIASRLRYVGVPFSSVYEAVTGLLAHHLADPDDDMLPEDQLITRDVEEYDPARREFVTKHYFGLAGKSLYTQSLSSLRSVPLVTERPDGSRQLLGARLYGHVYQSYLPGQFTVIGGKYYEVVSISDSSGVVLRRAADHFSQRRYYRQLRTYVLEDWEPEEGINSTRTLSGITVGRIALTMQVKTHGYLELSSFGNVADAREVKVSDVPERSYSRKSALRLEFPGASSEVVVTLATLMSEFMVTLFPKDLAYIAVLASCANSLPEGILARVEGQCPPNVIYIVEDSLTDIGLVSCVDRNIERILELCWDYLDWHADQLAGAIETEPTWEVGELPDFVPPPLPQSFFHRLLERLRKRFARKSSKPMPTAATTRAQSGETHDEPHTQADANEPAPGETETSGRQPYAGPLDQAVNQEQPQEARDQSEFGEGDHDDSE